MVLPIKLKDFLKTKIQIIHEPDDRLRRVSDKLPVTQFKYLPKLQKIMLKLMSSAQGIGLAAPQIGLNYRVILVLRITNPENPPLPLLLVNPQIIDKEGQACIEEGCLSIPGQRVAVNRAEQIKVQYYNLQGQLRSELFTGITAICIQHEIDHLDGILMTDYL